MSDTTFNRPDLSAFSRLDNLGLEVWGQYVEEKRTVLACRVMDEDLWYRRCGCEGVARDTVIRRLAHEPYGWRRTILHVSARRYRCQACSHVWRQDMGKAADPRAKLSRAAVRWALAGLVVHHLTVARIADALAVSWNTVNTAVLSEGRRAFIADASRFEGVRVIGVVEHVWRHTRPRRQVRHRHLGLDAHPRPERPLASPGHGPGPLQADLQDLLGPSDTPRHASVEQFGAHAGPEGDPLVGLGPIRPACSTVRPWPPSTAVQPPRAGRSGGRRGAIGADRARGGPREGRPPKARARRPLDGPGAHRVGDLGSFSLRGRTDRGRQVVADAARRHAPGRITPMDHQRLARPGLRCPLSPPAAARGQPARPLGATGPEGPHLRINGPWPLPLPRAGTRRRSRPAPPTTPDDRSAQR